MRLGAKLQGDVVVSALVDVAGVPTDITVIRGLGMGLDVEQVTAAQLPQRS